MPPHPADRLRFSAVPSWSAILTASVCAIFVRNALLICDRLLTQATLAAAPNTIGPVGAFLASPAAWTYWAGGAALMTAIGIGALMQRHSARIALRTAAAASILLIHPLMWLGVLRLGRAPSATWFGADLVLLWFGVTLQFRHEASPRLGDFLRQWPREVIGSLIVAADQLRRLAGFSYYPRSTSPIAASRGGMTTRAELAAARGVMDLSDGLWLPVGAVSSSDPGQCEGSPADGGGLLICDPSYLNDESPAESGVRIAPVPPGEWTVEVQFVRAIGDRRPRPVRARVIWGDAALKPLPELRYITLGAYGLWTREPWIPEEIHTVGVDSGRLCIIDPARLDAAAPSPHTGLRADVESETGDITPVISTGSGRSLGIAFTSGSGDGVYPVFLLRVGDEPIGLLVDMAESIYNNTILCPRRSGWRSAKRSKAATVNPQRIA